MPEQVAGRVGIAHHSICINGKLSNYIHRFFPCFTFFVESISNIEQGMPNQDSPDRGDLFVEINAKRERKLRRSDLMYAKKRCDSVFV